MAAGPRIGIDFGTSHTVALIAWPDGRVRPLLFDGSPLLPSAVYAQPDGQLLVGRDAVHAARVDPSRFEASPKRRIDDGAVLLGDREFTVPALVAAVLAHVGQEATRVGGGPPSALTLTHPASWGVSRRLALIEGARLAGLPQPALMPEPVAAAHYFAEVLGRQLAADQGLLVYDFGGGTFDASMVVRNGDGFDVRGVDGIDDLGGLDLDELIVDYAKEQVPDDTLWARLTNPQNTEDRRHRRLLWDDARMAKEMLSRSESAGLHLPIAAVDVTVPRAAFEQRARPMLEQTVRTTNAVLRWAGGDKSRLAGVFLVGGSSRIPLIATLLERELGVAPTVIEQPELVVGEGSLRTARHAAASRAGSTPPRHATPTAPPISAMPSSAPPISAMPTSAPPISAMPTSAPPITPSPNNPSPNNPTPISASPISATPISASPASAMPVSPTPVSPPRPANAPMNHTLPVWPVPAAATPMQIPAMPQSYQTGPHYQPEPHYQSGPHYQPAPAYQAGQPPAFSPGQPGRGVRPALPVDEMAPRPRRNVAVPILTALLVLSLALAGFLVFRQRHKLRPNNAGLTAPTSAPASPAHQIYLRKDRPDWVPDGWTEPGRFTADQLWVTQNEVEGGRCQTGGNTLNVTTADNPLTACQLKDPLDKSFTDVAVEVQVALANGCAGIWARTGPKGYALLVCKDRTELHRLANDAPSDTTRLARWPLDGVPAGTVVGLLVQGKSLTVYVNGKALPPVQDDTIKSGRTNAGAIADGTNHADVVFTDFRVFSPSRTTAGPAPTPGARSKSATPSASVWPSGSPSPSARVSA